MAAEYGPLAATAWWCGLATTAALLLIASLAYAPRVALGISALSALSMLGQWASGEIGF